MLFTKPDRRRADFTALSFALLFIALPWSRFLTTTGLFGLGIAGVWAWYDGIKLYGWGYLSLKLGDLFDRDRPWWLFLCFVLPVLISGLWSEDLFEWLSRMRLRATFLVFPLAGVVLSRFDKKTYHTLATILLGACVISGLMVMARYAYYFEEMTVEIGRGAHIKTPISHIRYSMVLCMGLFFGLETLRQKVVISSWRFEQTARLLALVLLFFILHILVVRSGLVVLYAGLFIFALYDGWLRKRWHWPVAAVVIPLLLLPLAYRTVPSFRLKVDYTLWDLKMSRSGQGNEYSDGDRWVSMQIARQIIQKSMWLGVGAGDLQREVETIYNQDYPTQTNHILPHNQYLQTWSSIGIFGLFFLFLGWLAPLSSRLRRQSPLIWVHVAMIGLTFLFEAMLENSSSINIHTIWLGLIFLSDEY
jgi:O-antigen ligase